MYVMIESLLVVRLNTLELLYYSMFVNLTCEKSTSVSALCFYTKLWLQIFEKSKAISSDM